MVPWGRFEGKGEIAVSLATGPSLRDTDFGRLERLCRDPRVVTIAVNGSAERFSWPDYLVTVDSAFMRRRMNLPNFKGRKVATFTLDAERPEQYVRDDVLFIELRRKKGLSRNRGRLHAGGNSGFVAIGLAYLTGARFILLLGHDQRHQSQYWHDEGEVQLHKRGRFESRWVMQIPAFKTAAEQMKGDGIEVLNASPESALDFFDRCTPEEGLNELERRLC